MPASPSHLPETRESDQESASRSALDDAAWVLAIQSGSKAEADEAFRRLMRKHWRVIHLLSLQRVGNRRDAEDITQETFVRAFRSIRKLEEPVAFLGWLLRIARNLALDCLRGRRKTVSLDAIPEAAERCEATGEIERADEHDRVLAALEEIPEAYREVIVLRYLQGLDGKTMAEQLGEPEGTVRNRLFRALEKLRERLSAGQRQDRQP